MLSIGKSKLHMPGFTLVEMIVVMAVLSILLAIAAPSLQTFMRNAQVRSLSESLLAGINLARSEAIRRNTQVSFWMVTNTSASCASSDAGNAWVVSLDSPANNCDTPASPTTNPRIVQTHIGSEAATGINIAATTNGGAAASCISFNGFGAVESACPGGLARLAVINLTSESGGRALRIQVDGGSVRLCDPSISDSANPVRCPS